MRELYVSERLTISWEERERYLKVVRRGSARGEAFRGDLEKNIELLAAHGARKQFNDFREMQPVSPEDQDYINQNWLPRLVRAGLRYSAVLAPESDAAQISLTAIVARVADAELRTMFFGSEHDAIAWLRSL